VQLQYHQVFVDIVAVGAENATLADGVLRGVGFAKTALVGQRQGYTLAGKTRSLTGEEWVRLDSIQDLFKCMHGYIFGKLFAY